MIPIKYGFLLIILSFVFFLFWPILFFSGWSIICINILDLFFDKITNNSFYYERKNSRITHNFENEDEKKLYILTKLNTCINKKMSNNVEKLANKSTISKFIFSSYENLWITIYKTSNN